MKMQFPHDSIPEGEGCELAMLSPSLDAIGFYLFPLSH
jgi:hypothetical protein